MLTASCTVRKRAGARIMSSGEVQDVRYVVVLGQASRHDHVFPVRH